MPHNAFTALKRRVGVLLDPNGRALLTRRARAWRTIVLAKRLRRNQTLTLNGRCLGERASVFIIAEIGVNHNGDVATAKRLIDEAVAAGADAVKFQKRDLYACYTRDVIDHPERYEQAFQYLIPLLKRYELDERAYRELARHAEEKKILLIATPFDEPSVAFLERVVNPPFYKVASADLINTMLLERLAATKKPLILSTGMANLDEIDASAAFLLRRKIPFALLHCQSTYPAPEDALNLAMIPKLARRYGVPIGYSGHELGIDHTVEAVALGAKIVERHITLDQKAPGPDHAASLTSEQFCELVRRVRAFETARGVAVKRISRGEVANRPTLRKSLVAARAIIVGERIARQSVTAKSPGTGLSPQRLYELVGTRALRNLRADDLFTDDDLALRARAHSPESFGTHWGLKARYRETEVLMRFEPRPKFLEFHVSDKDLDYRFEATARYPFALYVHAPEYFGTDVIDLGADDDRLREQSIVIMQRTIDQTRAIAKHFDTSVQPKIIIHVGGISIEKHPHPRRLFERSLAAFRHLDAAGVELLPENLPPYGWFFAGQWHCNIFGIAEEMIEFCAALKLRMCFDTSHAWLYCTHLRLDFLEYVKKVAPYIAHFHLSDGRGSQKEGLQIGTGDIPFAAMFDTLREHLPEHGKNVSWVPEIWLGHLDDYREFRIALEKLAAFTFLRQ